MRHRRILIFQEYLTICRCNHSSPSSSANKLSDSCRSLLFFNKAFFCKMMDSINSILLTDLIAFIWSRNILFTPGLLWWFICSFRKHTRSSTIFCKFEINFASVHRSQTPDGCLKHGCYLKGREFLTLLKSKSFKEKGKMKKRYPKSH